MFIIDFDDTLFDTAKYKKAKVQSLLDIGVSEEDFWKSYERARNAGEQVVYNNTRHAKELEKEGYAFEQILEVLSTVDESLYEFVFPDTLDFLFSMQESGREMILLSLGEESFQRKKVESAGIQDFFDEIHFVSDSKHAVIEKLLSRVQEDFAIFINDKVKESLSLQESFPTLHSILKVSATIAIEEYEDSFLPYFYSLEDVQNYVKTIL